MTIRPPTAFAPKSLVDPLSAALEHEILAEKAATLGRLLRRLEAALKTLDDCTDETGRTQKIDAAGEALWHVVIQRDICGFTQTERFMADMKVPKTVRQRMGVMKNTR